MSQTKFKNFIFDFDGTLADTFALSTQLVFEINKELNILPSKRINPEDIRSSDMAEFLSKLKTSKIQEILFLIKYRNKANNKITSVPSFVNLPETIHKLKENGVTLGIVTSNGKKLTTKFLKSHDMDLFDFVFSSLSFFKKSKKINLAIKRRHLIKEETIYIGDEVRDILAAKEAGIKVAAVTWGYNAENRLTQENPDYIINRPEELLTLIQ